MKVQRICIGILDDEGPCGECTVNAVGPGLVGLALDDASHPVVLCDSCLSVLDCRHAQILMFLIETDRLVSRSLSAVQVARVFVSRLRYWGFEPRAFRDAVGQERAE